jgi:hypothetical protein
LIEVLVGEAVLFPGVASYTSARNEGLLLRGSDSRQLKTLQHTHKGKRLRLFFQDEAKGRVCRVWWKRGQRPPGLCDRRFTFAYIFAAVEPGTDNAFALVLPHANTEADAGVPRSVRCNDRND